jgi:hypothetical protein
MDIVGGCSSRFEANGLADDKGDCFGLCLLDYGKPLQFFFD